MVVRDRMLNLVLHAFDTRHRRPPTEPFEDEFHPRLRYVHRGLVAMANNGTKNSNDSQFFITLGALLFFFSALRILPLFSELSWIRSSG